MVSNVNNFVDNITYDPCSNQAVNFTMYQFFKTKWQELSNKQELAPWQHMLIGGISGGFGPAVNNPLDVVKTRMQRQVVIPGQRPPVSLGGSVL